MAAQITKVNAVMPEDVALLESANIDPNSVLPPKQVKAATKNKVVPCLIKQETLKNLRIQDEQDFVNRFAWGLPDIDTQTLERMLYYQYQVMVFWDRMYGKFFYLPCTLSSAKGRVSLDMYGRWLYAKPLPFNSSTNYFSGIEKEILWEIPDEITPDMIDRCCVIIRDYTPQYAQEGIPRQLLQDSLLNQMAEVLPFTRTAIVSNLGMKMLRVEDKEALTMVNAVNDKIVDNLLNGNFIQGVVSMQEFQELTGVGTISPQDLMVYYESLNNLRLERLGISNNGTYQKSTYVNDGQGALNGQRALRVFQDSLNCRQTACEILNAFTLMGAMVVPSESVMGDLNGSGQMVDDNTEQTPDTNESTGSESQGGEANE